MLIFLPNIKKLRIRDPRAFYSINKVIREFSSQDSLVFNIIKDIL